MGEHVIRRGDGRGFPRTFEQRPTTKLDGDELRRLLETADPLPPVDLSPEIEIVTPRLEDILPREPPVATGSSPDIAVASPAPAPIETEPTRTMPWLQLGFALLATAWILLRLAGL